MLKDKVSEIEFHATFYELDDLILRAAELIKEGYSLKEINTETVSISAWTKPEPSIRITFAKETSK